MCGRGCPMHKTQFQVGNVVKKEENVSFFFFVLQHNFELFEVDFQNIF